MTIFEWRGALTHRENWKYFEWEKTYSFFMEKSAPDNMS
jgi:hypothetical protein